MRGLHICRLLVPGLSVAAFLSHGARAGEPNPACVEAEGIWGGVGGTFQGIVPPSPGQRFRARAQGQLGPDDDPNPGVGLFRLSGDDCLSFIPVGAGGGGTAGPTGIAADECLVSTAPTTVPGGGPAVRVQVVGLVDVIPPAALTLVYTVTGLPAHVNDPGVIVRPPFCAPVCGASLTQAGASASGTLGGARPCAEPLESLVIDPSGALLAPGGTRSFAAYRGPSDANGHAVLGADGRPGTADDAFQLTSAGWSVTPGIGLLSMTQGITTTLTTALPPGSTRTTGQVVATAGGLAAAADITVAQRALVIAPAAATVERGEDWTFAAFQGFLGQDGNPDLGSDGQLATPDDPFVPAVVGWSLAGAIGTLSAQQGVSTTLTTALPLGSARGSGQVVATTGSLAAACDVAVVPPSSDLNGDGAVDGQDIREFLDRQPSGETQLDFDNDGEVDFADFINQLIDWNPLPDGVGGVGGGLARFDATVAVEVSSPGAAALGLRVTHLYATGDVGPGDRLHGVGFGRIEAAGATFHQDPAGGDTPPAAPRDDTFVTLNRLTSLDDTTARFTDFALSAASLTGSWYVIPEGDQGLAVDIGATTGNPGQAGVLIAQLVLAAGPEGEDPPGYAGTVTLFTRDAPQGVEAGVSFTAAVAGGGRQVPGDCNQDGTLDLSDAVCTLGVLFTGSPAAFPCGEGLSSDPGNVALLDWQPDGRVDLSDPVSILQFLFAGGRAHPAAVPGAETRACVALTGCPENPRCR